MGWLLLIGQNGFTLKGILKLLIINSATEGSLTRTGNLV